MKKNFKFYIIIWAIFLVLYNLTVFLIKPVVPGYVINYDARFWISWGVIIATYIGQLFCSKLTFDSKNNEKLFLNIPLITQSYTSLVVATIAGTALMLIPDCPMWIAAIVCAAVLGLSVISIIKAKVAADIVSETDDKIKAQTSFIKTLIVDAESLMSRAQNETAKAAAKKVYEAVRYSDPMSHDGLSSIESEIAIKFNQFAGEVTANSEDITTIAEELIVLISDRNKRCRLLK
ncbi:MAG: hypothetical protein J6Q92_05735 [Oscillospiraceae bacterium]|nr:hypothetical protein [Oscillospiraceae bacterium]